MTYEAFDRSSNGSSLMPNQLAVGAAGGSASAFLLSALHTFLFPEDSAVPFQVPPLECYCPAFPWEEYPNLPWFVTGLICGILTGPLVDLIWICRERWRRFVISRLIFSSGSHTQRQLYKVLHE